MRLPFRLHGPAPAWPRPLDAALEWWAGLPTRARVALRAAAAVVVAVAVAGGLVQGPWGAPAPVVVTARDVAAGAPLTPGDLEVARRPRGLVPPDALTDPATVPTDAIADGHLPAGTVLTHRAVSAGGPGGAATPGTAVVPVPADALPPLPIGTRLDLAVAGFDGTTRIVARDAALVADDGTWRWLRIERDAVGEVARGITDATLVAAVLPPLPAAAP